MTRACLLALALLASLPFVDGVIRGAVQCESVRTCPVHTEAGGRP